MAITVTTNLHFGTGFMGTRAAPTTSVARITQNVAASSGFGVLITPPVTGIITDLSLYASGITTSVTNLDVGIMGLSAFGNTYYKADDVFISSNTVSIGSTGWKDVTLTTGVGVSAFSSYYLVAKKGVSYTGDAYFQITNLQATTNNHHKYSSYDLYNSSTGWQTPTNSYLLGYAYKINSKWYGPPSHGAGFTQLPVVTNTDENGFSFQLNSGHPDVRVYSFWMSIGNWNRESYQSLKVYNSSGTLICTFDTSPCDGINSLTAFPSGSFAINRSGTECWLQAGQKYYFMNGLTATPSYGTTIRSYVNNIDSTKKELLSNVYTVYTASKVSGVFSENTTTMPDFGITIDAIRY